VPQNRDDAIYGVFTEGNSNYDSKDDKGSHRRHQKRHKDGGSGEADLTKPVQLVSSGKFMTTQEPEPTGAGAANPG
jgi:tuftelin-interacting protein 11